jgi:hypothetical protein
VDGPRHRLSRRPPPGRLWAAIPVWSKAGYSRGRRIQHKVLAGLRTHHAAFDGRDLEGRSFPRRGDFGEYDRGLAGTATRRHDRENGQDNDRRAKSREFDRHESRHVIDRSSELPLENQPGGGERASGPSRVSSAHVPRLASAGKTDAPCSFLMMPEQRGAVWFVKRRVWRRHDAGQQHPSDTVWEIMVET